MIETLLVINIIALLTVGGVTITVCVLVLKKARRYVELAERRMEVLREGQARLAQSINRGRQSLRAGTSVGQLQQSEQQRAQLQEEIEGRIDQLKRQLRELREAQQDLEVREEAYAVRFEESFASASGLGHLVESYPESGATYDPGSPRAAESTGAGGSETVDAPEEGERRRLAKWHPHPDDSTGRERPSARRARAQDRPVQMFREHYDRYLENYEGYVKLAEEICQESLDKDVTGSPAEHEWEDKLRRINDAIRRTTARLDILEQYNPELATDERITHRAGIAESYAKLEQSLRTSGTL